MNYQIHSENGTTRYTVNGVEYNSLEEMPENLRQHFANIDKNNNGIPDNFEPIFDAINPITGKASVFKLFGALFKTMKNEVVSTKNDTIEIADFEEVKPTEAKNSINSSRYNQRGGAVQPGESSIIPTIIKVLVALLIGLTIAWYFELIT